MSTRRVLSAVGVTAVLFAGAGVSAYQAAGQAPAAPPAATPGAPAADPFLFTSEAGQVIFPVKADKASDFESAWAEIKAKTSASDKADWKAFGESFSLWRVAQPGAPPDAPAVYVLQIAAPSKTLSYDPGKILFATKEQGGLWERAAADALYTKIRDALPQGFNVLAINKVK